MISNPRTAELFKNVMKDVARAAVACGCEVEVDKLLEQQYSRVANIGPGYKPSMHLDAIRNQPMETEVILGNPVRRAKDQGVNVPFLETMYALCATINAKKQGKELK